MRKFKCEKSKSEILNIIVNEFEKINEEYGQSLQNNEYKTDRNFGRYIAMINLLEKLKIYED